MDEYDLNEFYTTWNKIVTNYAKSCVFTDEICTSVDALPPFFTISHTSHPLFELRFVLTKNGVPHTELRNVDDHELIKKGLANGHFLSPEMSLALKYSEHKLGVERETVELGIVNVL